MACGFGGDIRDAVRSDLVSDCGRRHEASVAAPWQCELTAFRYPAGATLGLDWNPGNRPRPGFEAEFRRLADDIRDQRVKEGSPEHNRFFEISVSAYETLQAPRVGSDPRADDWIRRKYHQQAQQMSGRR